MTDATGRTLADYTSASLEAMRRGLAAADQHPDVAGGVAAVNRELARRADRIAELEDCADAPGPSA